MTTRYHHTIERCKHGWIWDIRRGSLLDGGLAPSRAAAIRECLRVRQAWHLLQIELSAVHDTLESMVFEMFDNRDYYRTQQHQELARLTNGGM